MSKAVTQFSVFLVSKPGVLAQVCDSLARNHVNITALSMMDSTEHGVLRFVADNADTARQCLRKLNLPMTETDVLMTELQNRPGAMADLCARLGAEHIAINYAYCTAGNQNGRPLAFLKVSDLKRALVTVEEARKPRRKSVTVMRRPGARV